MTTKQAHRYHILAKDGTAYTCETTSDLQDCAMAFERAGLGYAAHVEFTDGSVAVLTV